ncbi:MULTISPECIES: ATP-dependent DNA ligase [Nostocales]|uniref:DNA ligase n=2 Tax=Nostocales TaxID=1161 RepID=A0A8S9T509_9CYAN|nr:ATP-dependent DNA ligase [Tolypothrix bouteillei]KAF3886692.1 ATP-dependent DNA ligase [Tolypothrix bouteillei VB521301]
MSESPNNSPTIEAGELILFAEVAERIAATSKRTEKAALLGDYFTKLCDRDLILAARYFSGYLFPLRDQRTVNIGGAALLTAIATVSGMEKSEIQEKIVKKGDPGDVAFEVFPHQVENQPSLSLLKLSEKLEQLAIATGTKRKISLLTDLLKLATPLEAKYIVKLLAGDLRIGLKEGAVEDAIARLFKLPIQKIQWVNMLTGDIGETAVLARNGQLDQAKMRLFHPIKFMLASPVTDLTEVTKQMPVGFAVEDKYDGIRAQVHIAPALEDQEILHGTVCNNKRIAIFSRTLDEITPSFPDLINPLASLIEVKSKTDEASGLILDGEIVPIHGEEILPFQELQKRLGRKKVSEELLNAVPVAFVAYDVLYEERVLINEPFETRRTILESLHLNNERIRLGIDKRFADISNLDEEFTAARKRGNEGLMVKDLNSTYKPGRRGREWLKVKRAIATLDVVVTAAEVGTGKRSRFLSDFTFAVRKSEDDPTLLNVGKAYSGLTDAEVTELSNWFRAHTLRELEHGRVCVVEPKIVLEITFDRVQPSDRHNSGYALRFPRILRIRNDKPVEEIDTLETVKRLAQIISVSPQDKEAEETTKPMTSPSLSFSTTPTLETARDAFQAFVERMNSQQRQVILHDSDADGIAAGVVLQLALSKAGFGNVTRVIPDRERNAWTSANRQEVQDAAPNSLFVLDLGSQSEPVIPGIPTCFIDHHRPEGVPPGDTLISAYTWEPIPNTSLIVWELCKGIVDVSDLDWIAAIGTVSDLGEKAPFEMLGVAKSKYTAKYLKEVTALINAVRRASQYNPEVAARVLLTHNSPRDIFNSNTSEVEQLRSARAEVKAAMDEARKAAPMFAGNVALLQINSPCQIHPLIAQSWRSRLPKYIVIVANSGYIPGRVNFSVRTDSEINVLDFLRNIGLSEGEGNYGHGHDFASGGSLPVERWHELLAKLGFKQFELVKSD